MNMNHMIASFFIDNINRILNMPTWEKGFLFDHKGTGIMEI